MDLLKDLIYVNKTAGTKTIKSLTKNWLIIFTGIVYTILNLVVFSIINRLFVGPLFILSGMVVAIITSSLISNYLYLLFNIINYDRITLQDFKDGFGAFLWKIYGVLFIAYIGSLLLSIISPILGDMIIVLNFIIYISILVLLNPLPETIYIKSYSPWESISYAVEFMQENWLNWLIPNLGFNILLYLLTGDLLTDVFNTHLFFNALLNPRAIILYLLGQIIFSFMMIYRGHLYKILSTSTRRKRMFMNKF
ncbi:hypothetical protein [Wansuia hejianensis]|uniref:Uncharacterized protein n=1 Tax=Wansuia hejianensis TaxID=2763667 RepID=A0A926EWP1_9FIRM|nr:hypothetical protein [Wansuia hejianensis]MBC8591258.1 hypothetical protein [Wansuia hejianensis]